MMVEIPVLTAFLVVAGLAAAGEKRIRLERTVRSKLPFSDAVWHGDTLYLSGHIGLDPQTGIRQRLRKKRRGWCWTG